METKDYFEKVMQDYNQNRKGRTLRKYCKDEAVDYDWLIKYKNSYPGNVPPKPTPEAQPFIPLAIEDEKKPEKKVWQVASLRLESPDGSKAQSDKNFQKIMLAELPIKSGLRSYGELREESG